MAWSSFLPHHIQSQSSPWRALLDQSLRQEVQEVVLFVAERMRGPEQVQQIAQLAREQSPSANAWDLSLPSAVAQFALFYSHLDRCFPGQGWQKTAQHYLQLIAVSSQQRGLTSPSLFGGISGIAFVIQQCSNAGQRFQQTLARLHQTLVEQIRMNSSWHLPLTESVAESDFDLISGASGILGYLTSIPSPDLILSEPIDTLLDYLITLAEPGQALGREHWFCYPAQLPTEYDRQHYPSGRLNCGLAHGIPGPLAALALGAKSGYHRHGLREALLSGSTWLIEHSMHDEWGINWPATIPYEHALSPLQWSILPAARTAWCYGAPGIARSLWLAGQALSDTHLKQVALDALKAVLSRPVSKRNIDSPTLCHGTAGLLLICLHFARESQDAFLLEEIPQLVESLLAQFDPQSLLGFCDIEPGNRKVDQPDLLTGAPGTALALLAAASDVAPSWDRLLLLS